MGDIEVSDVNPSHRPPVSAQQSHPTLIQNDVLKKGQNLPNSNMNNAHAEIAAMQRLYEKTSTQGKELTLQVKGKEVCSHCLSDIKNMGQKMGLKSVTVYEEVTGKRLIWQKGNKKWIIKN
ncbi:cytidine deaminase-like fold-containing protein [Paralysiella testudinis]|uniref:Putative cytidine deaminase C-terminal domain-containing protein n=1 Tax=Paralysiella testudinis TaxID=2809020 RepID=A0A892ZI80_9NEIS|nr:hypothetical protein [Paralysiella testudinis]QRQ82190.1 hypothetical protein JQU52_01795 [Paralysiella testudinis]